MKMEINRPELHAIANDLCEQMVRITGLGIADIADRRKKLATRLIEIYDALLAEEPI